MKRSVPALGFAAPFSLCSVSHCCRVVSSVVRRGQPQHPSPTRRELPGVAPMWALGPRTTPQVQWLPMCCVARHGFESTNLGISSRCRLCSGWVSRVGGQLGVVWNSPHHRALQVTKCWRRHPACSRMLVGGCCRGHAVLAIILLTGATGFHAPGDLWTPARLTGRVPPRRAWPALHQLWRPGTLAR